MVSYQELGARIKADLTYSKQETVGLLAIIIVTAFIFTFRDWGGDVFDVVVGIKNFAVILIVAAVSFFFKTACQKVYGLAEGVKAEFKTWWTGLGISLVVTFISFGYVPLLVAGAMAPAFIVRQRLGEFRYGYSYWNHANVAAWGILGHLIVALLSAFFVYYFPESYIFSKALEMNLLLAFFSLVPLPQLDGLNIFLGSRVLYYFMIALAFIAAVLLLSRTTFGLVFAFIIAIIYAFVYTAIGSEK